MVGGGTKCVGEFVDGLRIAAAQISSGGGGGKKDGQVKHKRRRSGLPALEGTLALGYTYIDILDEENDGVSFLLSLNLNANIDILARLTFSLFPNPTTALKPLLHETLSSSLLE